MPELVLGTVRLRFNVYEGPAGATPVLLLHGLGSCAEDWLLQVPALTARYPVIVPDLRGHGASRGAAGWPTMATHASDMAALVSHLGAERAHVVGLSLGGAVALQMALDTPQAVRSLVLVNAFARWLSGPRGWARGARRAFFAATGQMARNGRIIAQGLFPREDQAFLRRAAETRLAGNSSSTYFRNLMCVARFDVRRRLEAVGCPTLVVAGERDTTVPFDLKAELAHRIPRARLEIVADSGHATPIDAAGIFNRMLLEFLGQAEVSGSEI